MIIYIICDENNRVTNVGTSPIGDNPIELEYDSWDIFDNTLAYMYDSETNTISFDEEYAEFLRQQQEEQQKEQNEKEIENERLRQQLLDSLATIKDLQDRLKKSESDNMHVMMAIANLYETLMTTMN